MKQRKKQQKSRSLSILVMMILILTLAFSSCTSIHKESKVDQLVWATFPDPIGIVTRDKATNIVSMPYSYWKQIENYVIETEKNIEILTK